MILLVDGETGKVLEDKVLIIGKKPYLTDKNFTKVFVCFLRDVVGDKEISGKAIRLLLYILTKVDYNTKIFSLNYREAIEELGISERTFYTWTSSLQKAGIIKHIGHNLYELSEYTAVKGSEYLAHVKSKSCIRKVKLVKANSEENNKKNRGR